MSRLFKKLYWPDLYINEIDELDWTHFYAQGYRLLFCDLDNTLQSHGSSSLMPEAKEILEAVLFAGFEVAIISNAKTDRADELQKDIESKGLKIKVYGSAQKPSPKKLLQAAADFNQPIEACLLLGDQVFTDIRAGKRAAVFSILIKAFSSDEPWYIRLKRLGEKMVLSGLKRWRKVDYQR